MSTFPNMNFLDTLLDSSNETDYNFEYTIPEIKKYKFSIKKIMVVPYIRENGIVKVLTLFDSRYNEWTFLSGCCEQREHDFSTIRREMHEELEGLLNIDLNSKNVSISSFNFSDVEHHKKMLYNIYFIDITKTHLKTYKNIEKKYNSLKKSQKKCTENEKISFQTFTQFSNCKNMWSVVKNRVVENFHVHKILKL